MSFYQGYDRVLSLFFCTVRGNRNNAYELLRIYPKFKDDEKIMIQSILEAKIIKNLLIFKTYELGAFEYATL